MELSRKRQRELKKLKRGATELWENQKEVLDHATRVVREAKRQLANVSREEVAPRIRDMYESRILPGVESGWEASRNFAESARARVSRDVLPAVSSALGTALAALEVARSPQVRKALGKISRPITRQIVPEKSSSGAVRYILLGIGLVAAAGIAYAAWQTLRADDELWISDSPETTDND